MVTRCWRRWHMGEMMWLGSIRAEHKNYSWNTTELIMWETGKSGWFKWQILRTTLYKWFHPQIFRRILSFSPSVSASTSYCLLKHLLFPIFPILTDAPESEAVTILTQNKETSRGPGKQLKQFSKEVTESCSQYSCFFEGTCRGRQGVTLQS